MMRYLSWALRVLLFILLFGFALKNTAPVTVRFYLGSEWTSPLVLVLLAFFVAGAAAGVAAALAHSHRQRREIVELRRELRSRSGPSGPAPDHG